MPPCLLYFFVENRFCQQYFQKHIAPYDNVTEVYNLSNKDAASLDMASRFDVMVAPTLILLDVNGNEKKRWNGGVTPEPGYLSVEIGMAKEYERRIKQTE